MSMWLNLAKVSPELLARIRAEPDLLDTVFSDSEESLEGFDAERDLFEYDYRTLSAIADAKSNEDGHSDWRSAYPALTGITGEGKDFGDPLDYEVTYGPVVGLSPEEVGRLAVALVAEGWELDPEDGAPIADEERAWDEFDDLVPFVRVAAKEGKAIIAAIS